MFFVDHNITDSVNLLNSDPSQINEWALQSKISFNTDPTKQAPEIIFSHKNGKRTYTGLLLSYNIVNLTTIHKHSEKLRKISKYNYRFTSKVPRVPPLNMLTNNL